MVTYTKKNSHHDRDRSLSPILTAPGVGIEPTTNRLTGDRSTAELPRNLNIRLRTLIILTKIE